MKPQAANDSTTSMFQPPRSTLGRVAYWGVALTILLAGTTAGWQLRAHWHENELTVQRASRLIDTILTAHQTFSANDSIRPEFAPDQLDALNSYSTRQVGLTLQLADPGPSGLEFSGGRLLPLGGTSALLLTFRTGEGPVSIAAFREAFPFPRELPKREKPEFPVNVLRDAGYVTAVVGKLPESALEYVMKTLQRVKADKNIANPAVFSLFGWAGYEVRLPNV